MRVATAFNRLLDLQGAWVRKVSFEPARVVVTVALKRRRLQCPKCSYSTPFRESRQHHDSVWRHLDLGVWRLEIHARLRRLRCPEHGALVEGVPFARYGARFTRDFEDLVTWLVTKTDRTAVCRLVRIDWETVGRIIKRVGDELLPADRLNDLFEISLDEVAWRKGHRYLTLVGDHRQGCVVWGTEGKGAAAADEFFAELDPDTAEGSCSPPDRPESRREQAKAPADQQLERPVGERAAKLVAVSMDMTGGYAKSVREHAPQAVICIDNYHVVALASKALDEVRREHWNELRGGGATDAAKEFKEDTTHYPPRWLPGERPNRAGCASASGLLAGAVGLDASAAAARVVPGARGRHSPARPRKMDGSRGSSRATEGGGNARIA
jgi:transposase